MYRRATTVELDESWARLLVLISRDVYVHKMSAKVGKLRLRMLRDFSPGTGQINVRLLGSFVQCIRHLHSLCTYI